MDPFLIIMLVGMLALMFFTQSRARKNAATQNQFRASLQPGQRVMTQGGLIGTIVSINDADDSVILQSAGSTCEYKRAGISKTLEPALGVPAVSDLAPIAVAEPAYGALANTDVGNIGSLGNLGNLGNLGTLGQLGAPEAGADSIAYVVEDEPAEQDDFAILDSITREYHESKSEEL